MGKGAGCEGRGGKVKENTVIALVLISLILGGAAAIVSYNVYSSKDSVQCGHSGLIGQSPGYVVSCSGKGCEHPEVCSK